MSNPTSYREQSACANCNHCEMRWYYDSPNAWICRQDGEAEPSDDIPDGWWDKPGNPFGFDPQGLWLHEHNVEPNKICDSYEPRGTEPRWPNRSGHNFMHKDGEKP